MKAALAIVAHPDDIEFYAAGTLLLLKEAGFTLHFWNLADGGMGSRHMDEQETRRVRAAEARQSAEAAGATLYPPLFRDMAVVYSPDALAQVVAVIREVRPSILLTHCPHDYMEDHEVTCRLAVSAAFARGMANFSSSPSRDPVIDPLRIYHLMPHSAMDFRGRPVHPDLLVDIGRSMDRKAVLLGCHKSQNQWLEESQGMPSMESAMRAWAESQGRLSAGFLWAEGFLRHHHIGFCEHDFDPLIEVLPPGAVQRMAE